MTKLFSKPMRGIASFVMAMAAVSIFMIEISSAEEEYIMIHPRSEGRMWVENDHVGMKIFAHEHGVKARVTGPVEWDLDGFVKAIEEVIPQKPAGLVIYGYTPITKNAINKAIASGIPVIFVDGDNADTGRLMQIGTSWTDVGEAHAHQIAKLVGEEGEVAISMGMSLGIMQEAATAYKRIMAENYPKIKLVGIFDTENVMETAVRVAKDVITAYPNLKGWSGFDSLSPAIGVALAEAGKLGQVKVTAQDTEAPQLKNLEKGTFHVLIGQKRTTFAYYALKMLYDYNHSKLTITGQDAAAGIQTLPIQINTGIFLVTKENVKAFKEGRQKLLKDLKKKGII